MPVDLPNRKLFAPILPKSIDNHFLYGIKFNKVHQFADARWPQEALTHQYQLMANCLGKNKRYCKFKHDEQTLKRNNKLQVMRQECSDGRTRLKNAAAGDLTKIRRILMKRKDLQRKYKSMPLAGIMENCDQETFVKRRENDRLKFQLKRHITILKDALIQQSVVEDRIVYSNTFVLKSELDAKVIRKFLKTSLTRITAYKLIKRAYLNIIDICARDETYMESILDSLQLDLIEQKNFIDQIVLLGIPAKSKYDKLAKELKIKELQTQKSIKENGEFIGKAKKDLAAIQKITKNTVRSYVPTKNKKYLRTTPSMETIEDKMDGLKAIIYDIRAVTMSPNAEEIEPTVISLVNNIKYLKKKNVINDRTQGILGIQYDSAKAQKALLTHNYSQKDEMRRQAINDLMAKIEYEKKFQKKTNSEIVNIGNLLQILTFSVWNINEVLRNTGNRISHMRREYPNPDLNLPLLKFDLCGEIIIPPIAYDINISKLLPLAKEKLTGLMKVFTTLRKDYTPRELNVKYHMEYLKTLEEDDIIGKIPIEASLVAELPVNESNILTRQNIHNMSVKLCEKYKKKDTD